MFLNDKPSIVERIEATRFRPRKGNYVSKLTLPHFVLRSRACFRPRKGNYVSKWINNLDEGLDE